MRAKLSAALALAAILVTGNQVAAQGGVEDFPNRPVRFVVPFPAGGPADVFARILTQHMSEQWPKGFIIENRPGGNTAIGAQQVARAAPDGYTLLVALDTTLVMNAFRTTNISYKLSDFALVSLVATTTSILVVPASGAKSVEDLIATGRANKGKLNYGAGIIPTRLAGFLFTKMAGFEAAFVPYKGSAEVVQGLLDGSINYAVDGIAPHLNLVKDGRLRALAKLDDAPLASLPDLKPLHSFPGLKDLGNMSVWIGIAAPAGTPAPIVDKIYKALANSTGNPAVRERLANIGIRATSMTPENFTNFVNAEIRKWGPIVKESGIVIE